MPDTILQRDRELLVFLNNLGNEQWDPFWLFITNQFNWIPLFVLILYLIVKRFGWKNAAIVILTMAVLVTFSDQFTNLIKNTVGRIRPNNDPGINYQLRNLINPGGYSFYSGHATTSTFFVVYTILLLKERFRYIWLLVLFPLVFAYSRLYLGVHYPTDVLCGAIVGIIYGNLYYRLVKKIIPKVVL